MLLTTYSLVKNETISVLEKEQAVRYPGESLNSPEEIGAMINSVYELNKKAEEHAYVIGLNMKNRPMAIFLLSIGGVSQTYIPPAGVMSRLLMVGAPRFVLVHNHPSGDTMPSAADKNVVANIAKCADLLNLEFLDFIIVGDDIYSFRANNLMDSY